MNSIRIGDVVVIYLHQNFTKFHRIQMTNKKSFLMTHLMNGLSDKCR